MGQTVACTARHGGRESAGRAQLETDEIVFRGDFRLVVPRREITAVSAQDGRLELEHPGGPVVLELGEPAAARWAREIANPKTVVDKLGVKPGQRVSLVGLDDPELERRLRERGAELVAPPGSDIDHLFVAVEEHSDLAGLRRLVPSIARDGAVWTVRRKGRRDLTEGDVMAAGKAAGLVDVKVVRLSDTHTAEKFVIPVSRR
jgi:hypothetical protein